MFAPANPDVPQLEPSLKFKATIQSDNNILRTVLPLNDEIIKYNNQGSITDDPISVINAYTDVELINKVSFQVLMENFNYIALLEERKLMEIQTYSFKHVCVISNDGFILPEQ